MLSKMMIRKTVDLYADKIDQALKRRRVNGYVHGGLIYPNFILFNLTCGRENRRLITVVAGKLARILKRSVEVRTAHDRTLTLKVEVRNEKVYLQNVWQKNHTTYSLR